MTAPVRVGLWLLGVCSVLDIAAPALSGGQAPWFVAVAVAALGVASLVLVARALRGAERGIRWLIGLRIVSALSAVPAFIGTGVPVAAVVAAAVVVVANLVGVLLVAGGSRRVEVAP